MVGHVRGSVDHDDISARFFQVRHLVSQGHQVIRDAIGDVASELWGITRDGDLDDCVGAEAQAGAGAPIERIAISGGAGRLDLIRQLLADATGKPLVATEADDPVLLGSAILGAVAAGAFGDVPAAMARMSRTHRTYTPARGEFAQLHETRYRAFQRLQQTAREIR